MSLWDSKRLIATSCLTSRWDPSSINVDMLMGNIQQIHQHQSLTQAWYHMSQCALPSSSQHLMTLISLPLILRMHTLTVLVTRIFGLIWDQSFILSLKGKWALIVQSLFGLKSAGAAHHYHLATCMEHLGFISCQVDPDVWLHKSLAESGHHFYKYVLIYTDDIQAIAKDLHVMLQ